MFDLEFFIHLSVSASIYLLLRELFNYRVSIILCFLIGVFKEQWHDVYYLGSTFNVIDILGNVTGIILAFILDKKIW